MNLLLVGGMKHAVFDSLHNTVLGPIRTHRMEAYDIYM